MNLEIMQENIQFKNKILFHMHIMWYEYNMINETLRSIEHALKYSKIDIDFKFCINTQTYIETPINNNMDELIKTFIDHPLIQKSEVVFKTDLDPFYNIADWRRETYHPEYKYVVWGESDCLLPIQFFYILSELDIDEPHILTFASRKCWDKTWDIVVHPDLVHLDYNDKTIYNYDGYISQSDLNNFNNNRGIKINKLNDVKIDGALVCLSSNLPHPFIPEDMHFAREDTCMGVFMRYNKIPQYHVSTILKGHNYKHPNKRCNTKNTREEDVYKTYESNSIQAAETFLKKIFLK